MTTKRILSLMVLSAMLAGGSPLARAAFASDHTQEIKQELVRDTKAAAERHFQRGEEAYKSKQYDMARREFDEAVDSILTATINIATDDELRAYYRELIEKINRYQIISMETKDGGFSEQRYEPSPLDQLASKSVAELQEVDEHF